MGDVAAVVGDGGERVVLVGDAAAAQNRARVRRPSPRRFASRLFLWILHTHHVYEYFWSRSGLQSSTHLISSSLTASTITIYC
jgi:hypothetical protein